MTSLGLSGTDKGVYALVAPPVVPFTVAPGGKQTINVQFSPLLQGTYNNASVTLMSNVVGKETVVETLNGGCVAPKIQLTAGTLTFPTTNAGSQNTLSFGINNQGSAPLHVNGLTPVGLDISNPGAPVVQGTFATSGYANSVAVRGTTALVSDGSKVYRVGLANPAQPAALGQWTSDGYAMSVAIDGNYGYVANGR